MTDQHQSGAESEFEADETTADTVPPVPALEGYIAYHLRMAQNASFRAFSARTGQSDLRPGWYAVLSIIGAHPDIAPVAVSKAAGRDKSTMTPILREMMKQGLVEKTTKARDRRSYGLRLTTEGHHRVAEMAVHAQAHDRELDRIAGSLKPKLIKILKRISDEMG